MIPRWVHRAYAWVFGYFWLSCPVCGRMFGGHESGEVSVEVPFRSFVVDADGEPMTAIRLNRTRRIACNRHRYGPNGAIYL